MPRADRLRLLLLGIRKIQGLCQTATVPIQHRTFAARMFPVTLAAVLGVVLIPESTACYKNDSRSRSYKPFRKVHCGCPNPSNFQTWRNHHGFAAAV
jgi:hypothetical protein